MKTLKVITIIFLISLVATFAQAGRAPINGSCVPGANGCGRVAVAPRPGGHIVVAPRPSQAEAVSYQLILKLT